jgi:hypothetical protein
LTFDGSANYNMSSPMCFVVQRHLRFAGYVYDTGNGNKVPANPFVKITITIKRTSTGGVYSDPHDIKSVTGWVGVARPSTPLTCPFSSCVGLDPQYDYETWVPMLNGWNWQITAQDQQSPERYYPVSSAYTMTYDAAPEYPEVQQFDIPLYLKPTGTY